jgi:hypothetical protein
MFAVLRSILASYQRLIEGKLQEISAKSLEHLDKVLDMINLPGLVAGHSFVTLPHQPALSLGLRGIRKEYSG